MSLGFRFYAIFSVLLIFSSEKLLSYADPADPLNRCLTQRGLLTQSSSNLPRPVPIHFIPAQRTDDQYDDDSKLIKLISAIRYGKIQAITDICNNNPGVVNQFDDSGNLPLHYAVQSNYESALIMVKALVEIDPDGCTIENNDGDTPLTLARAYGRKDVTNYLEEKFELSHDDDDGELSQHASDYDSDHSDDHCGKEDVCDDDCPSLEEDTQSVSDEEIETESDDE